MIKLNSTHRTHTQITLATRQQKIFILLFVSIIAQACSRPENNSSQNHSLNSHPTNTINQRSAIVQLFDWPLLAIKAELCTLREQGFSHVHISPIQKSNSAKDWWGRYQPDDLRVIDSPLGNLDDFKAMMAEAKKCQIQIIADVVLNHMANFALNEEDLYYPLGCDRSRAYSWDDTRSCLYRPEHFHREECISNYGDHNAVLFGRICGAAPDRGLPDLKTGNASESYHPHVRQVVTSYLNMLYKFGVRGFRIDAAKHMSAEFISDAFSSVPSDTWIYGEIITNHRSGFYGYDQIQNLEFMDFPLTRSIIDAFDYTGSLDTLRTVETEGKSLSDKAIAFITNHDVWGNEGGLGYKFAGSEAFQDELLAHIFILGRGTGAPYVYSEYQNGPSLKYRTSEQSYVNFHRHQLIKNMLLFHTNTQGSTLEWRYALDQTRLAWSRGDKGFVAINKSPDAWVIDSSIDLGLADGNYINILDSNADTRNITVMNGRTNLTVPGRFAVSLLRD